MAEHRHSDRPRRKRQYSMIPFVALGIAVVLIVLIIIGITSCAKGCSEDSTQTVQEQTATTNTNAVKDSESSFKMSIAGDYIIYSSIYKGANENANGNGYDSFHISVPPGPLGFLCCRRYAPGDVRGESDGPAR